LHTIPSGVFREGTVNLVGNGVVIDPAILLQEVDALTAAGVDLRRSLLISRRAHLILPTHRALDAASEAEKGKARIGSTLKGIGPAYMDKTGRNGLRVGDLERPGLLERFQALTRKHERLLAHHQWQADLRAEQEQWLDAVRRLRELQFTDSEHFLDEALRSGKRVLAEGAQGTLLDVDFGTYPYVTSSNTTCAGACTGLGVAPTRIGKVVGIFKAYCTRVGSGPFPTELTDATGEHLRTKGAEFGSTTGRPRRCGWLDLPALHYAVTINGISELAMMKADVLNGMDTVRVCTGYRIDGRVTERLPYDISQGIEPVYEDMPGWDHAGAHGTLPANLEAYIERIERAVGVPVTIVSLGPDRAQTVRRQPATA
jgi:adenylosuccinate synthase